MGILCKNLRWRPALYKQPYGMALGASTIIGASSIGLLETGPLFEDFVSLVVCETRFLKDGLCCIMFQHLTV